MSYLSPSLIGWTSLRYEPVNWFVRQFVLYLSAAAIVGATFMVGAGLYAYFTPATTSVEVPGLPLRKPAPDLKRPPLETYEGALISQLKGKEIGVPILMQGRLYGTVTEVQVDRQGIKRFVVIELADSKAKLMWPYDSVNWYTEEQAKVQWKHSASETVVGSFKGLWGSVEKDSNESSPTFRPNEK